MGVTPVLFARKEDCCACGACLNSCPEEAIRMKEDEEGFLYPEIDGEKCIGCGRCRKVCAFQQTEETNTPQACYAAVSRNAAQAEKSASAGVFAAMAQGVIERGGIVYGAAFGDEWGVHHTAAENAEGLKKLQGSKYAQSDTERTFAEAKKQLSDGRKVLYSGTPCQIAGLRAYLGKEEENLYTVDIVCHGVPSGRMLKDYLRALGRKHGGSAERFTFRDKAAGWGKNGSAMINGKKVRIRQSESAYLYYFDRGWISRESCYRCKYTGEHRPADITLGDYWGIEKQHPECLGKKGWDEDKGISAVIVNTEKGAKLLQATEGIEKTKSSFAQIAERNAQLRTPCRRGKRDEIMAVYAEAGWEGVSARFEREIGIRRYRSLAVSLMPGWVRRKLKGR